MDKKIDKIDLSSLLTSSSWREVLGDEFEKEYFLALQKRVEKEYKERVVFPPKELLFNAFNLTPFEEVRVVILGQDPYHKKNQAMGLSFSVERSQKIPPSLRNIYKELHRSLQVEIPKDGDLSTWAKRGVFLLNAILSVEEGRASSHKGFGWESFSNRVIEIISSKRKDIVFMLWGNFAIKKRDLIDSSKHLILTSPHPSPLARGFIGNDHFLKANHYLRDRGLKEIDWNLSPI